MSGYIGRTPLSEAVQSRAKFTLTAGQTTVSFSYQPGFLDVYLNGVKLEDTTDYTATNGTDVILTSPALEGQLLETIGLSTYSLINGKINYSASAAPVVTDDSSDGYRVGSLWIDTTNDEAYRCVDDTVGAAVWVGTTLETTDLGALALKNTVATTDIDNLAVTDAKIAGMSSSKLTGALPAIDGSALTGIDALPDQTGHNGQYLTTNGTAADWATIDTDANTTTKGLYEHANTIAANYSITSGNNALSAAPVTINSGVSVTIPSGSTWVLA